MPKCLESMPTKHIWTFRSRLRSRAFGWKGSHLACQRLKEAVTEIRKVARVDPVTAGEGVVSLMERIWPAFQDIDTSSGALGGAVNWAQDELLPIVIEAKDVGLAEIVTSLPMVSVEVLLVWPKTMWVAPSAKII